MPGTFFGLNIGQSGLTAAQLGQDVTGHNIANSSTPGYSVESVDFVAADPLTPPDQADSPSMGMIGSGVVASSITRARDQYLDQQVRGSTSDQSNQSAQNDALSQIEGAFNEPSDTGLNTTLGTLFQNFNNLVNNPEDAGVRATVVQSGDAVARVFHDVSNSLTNIGQQLTAKQNADVNALNSYGRQIAKLNETIRSSRTATQNDNDLLDQRDELLDKLSGLANVSVINNPDGTVNVAVGTSDLVTGTDAKSLSLTGANSLTARGDLKSGELAGLGQAQTDLANYKTDLNNVAAGLISSVNALHQKGAGLDGSTGLNFFNGTDASDISINQTLVTDPNKLAAAAEPAGGGKPAPGDASNMTLLGALQNQAMTTGPLTGQTIQSYYQATISNLGGQGAATKTALQASSASTQQLTTQRDSITGVSTDDEMVNMMKYQRAYEASAKVVQTMDSMISTLITGLFSN